jgi:hypothetical protein
MTTQAQIEAAREAIARHLAASGHTFADGESACWGPSTLYPHEIAEAALTAAAQVGEPDKTPASRKLLNLTEAMWQSAEKECKEIEAATIERCAQTVEGFSNPQNAGDIAAIAAALRKMKGEA